MGRPDLTDVRREEILDAFASCVAAHGLEGSSLERVAEQAGMKRSILRHYVGNRDDLVDALAQRVVAQYRDHYRAFFADDIDSADRVGRVLAFFFPDASRESTEGILVVESLIAAGDRYPDVQALMLGYVDELVANTAEELRAAFPSQAKSRCWTVAYGLVCICFNQETLSPLGLPKKYLKSARDCARLLIRSLQ